MRVLYIQSALLSNYLCCIFTTLVFLQLTFELISQFIKHSIAPIGFIVKFVKKEINKRMPKYYKPITNYSYDGPALLSVLNTAIKGCPSEHVSGCHLIPLQTYVPTIPDILGKIFKDFRLDGILFFKLYSGQGSTVHKDVTANFVGDENLFAKMGLNLPLQNADKVRMKWYTAKEDVVLQPNYIPNAEIDQNNLDYIKQTPGVHLNRCDINRCVESTCYTNPIIVSINNWHSVTNESTEMASFVSVRFGKDVTPEKLISKFGPA